MISNMFNFRWKAFFLPIFMVAFFFVSCNIKAPVYIHNTGFIQGTTYSIKYESPDSISYNDEIYSLLKKFDKSLSTYDENSIISKINKNQPVEIDSLFERFYEVSLEINKATGGAFDITVAPIVNAWGFGFADSININQQVIDSLLQYVGMNKIQIKNKQLIKQMPEIQLDGNAIAQGYSVDIVAEFLESKNIKNYMVEIGGEVAARGKNHRGESWIVGIDKPDESNNVINRELKTILYLSDKTLATSGNYRKYYEKNGEKFSHTIDPAIGYPVRHNLLSATILADKCIYADAYATACMVIGLEKSIKLVEAHPELEALFIYADKNGDFQVYVTEKLRKNIID